MKTIKIAFALLVLAASVIPSDAAVGYINRTMHPGYSLIADQLFQLPDNSLNSVLVGTTPDGATFTKWNGTTLLPLSVFNANSQAWSINYTLNPAEGGMLWTPSSFTSTFVGTVPNYAPFTSTPWNPNYAPGFYLISSVMPVGGQLSYMFTNVVGRLPATGESVWTLDEPSQTYNQSTFNGGSWDIDVNITVGQSAWFDLGGSGGVPPVIPEPSSAALTVLAGIVLAARRRRN